MSQPTVSPSEVLFICISGPDLGKRVSLRDGEVVIGRSSLCDVLSDDPEVAERHVTLLLKEGRVACCSVEGALFLDGHRVTDTVVIPKQQLRIGRSLWQLMVQDSPGTSRWIGDLSDRISSVAGVEKLQGFDARDMFSEVLRSRTDDEIEEYFTVGTPSTTPALEAVNTAWPKPWVFFKTFTLSAVAYLGFVFAYHEFQNANLVPGLIMTGTFLIPVSLLIFFYEMNVLRNVSLYQVVKLFLFGGITSLILSLFLFRWAHLDSWLGAMDAGLIEETGKAAALFLVVNKLKYRYTLNGLLFGAAIGAGFSAFESAGYALRLGMQSGPDAMLDNITLRGVLSMVGGHILWTAMVGAALWRVRGDRSFSIEMLRDPRFLRIFGLAVGLHMLWNSPLALPFYFKQLVLGFVSWVVNLAMIQAGLQEVRERQQAQASRVSDPPRDPRLRSV
ncbi:PrsW family glutamic-type intramembrane protease [Nitrospira japonica]|nr:PrsW family glutamic-type intramembrane protease [Nitrospira japonica]